MTGRKQQEDDLQHMLQTRTLVAPVQDKAAEMGSSRQGLAYKLLPQMPNHSVQQQAEVQNAPEGRRKQKEMRGMWGQTRGYGLRQKSIRVLEMKNTQTYLTILHYNCDQSTNLMQGLMESGGED